MIKKNKKYINVQDEETKIISRGREYWYLPGGCLWGDRYIDEKKDVLTGNRNKRELNIIKRYVTGKKNILDIPCGYGRLSNALAKDGHKVTGVDINKYFIDLAEREAKKNKLPVKYFLSDIIKYKPQIKFDAVLNIFTSIGYYNSEVKNTAALSKLCSFVKPGGLLIIETINPMKLLRAFKKKKRKTTVGGTKILFKNFFDYRTSTSISEIVEKYKNGNINKAFHRIRLYYPHELINMCASSGLDILEILDRGGRNKNISNSKRMWLIFKK